MPNAPTLNPRLDPKGSNFVVTFRHPLHGGKLVCRGLKTSDETDAQSVCIDARRLFEREDVLQAPKSPESKILLRSFERRAVEVRPISRHEHELAISRLPQQEIG